MHLYMYVLEHIVSLNYRITGWIFTKVGRDKVLMTRTFVLNFGPNPLRADPGQGHNRSMRGPSPKNFFFTPKGYSNKPNALQLFRLE